jgi:antitoxin (DNA-binding transcriptional repressor) of toxin-antitoxin stability system
MKTVNIHAAKTSRVSRRSGKGKEIVIAKAGKPMARLMPLATKKSIASTLGIAKGDIRISDNFNDPLPPEELKLWGIE